MPSTKYHQLRNLEHLAIKAQIVQDKRIAKSDRDHQKNLLIAQKLEKKQFLETCSHIHLMFTKAEKSIKKPRTKSIKKTTVVAPVPVVPMEAVSIKAGYIGARPEEDISPYDHYNSDNYNYHSESDDEEKEEEHYYEPEFD
jgi:hypothetical protein